MNLNRKKAILYLIITAVLWSSGGLFIKLIDWNPLAVAGARSGIAAIVMLLYLRKPVIRLGKMKLLGAFSYAALSILFVTANKLTTSANAILLQFTAPIWVALFSGWILKEKTQKSDWITIIAVLFGMIFFFIGDLKSVHLIGDFVAVLSGVAMASMVFLLKLQDEGSPVEMTMLGNIFTFLIGLPFLLFIVPSWENILVILILGIFQLGISYILYSISVQHVSSIEAILIPIIEPLLNPIWVLLFIGESPGIHAIFGGIIVITVITARGVYLQRKNKYVYKEG